MTPPPEAELLATLLGGLHALHVPVRDPDHPAWPATWTARREYARRGLPWRAGGSKAAERLLARLARQGLVRRHRAAQKTVAVTLLHPGIDAASRLIGIDPIGEPAVFVRELLRLGGGRVKWIGETKLNNGRGWGDGRESELRIVEDSALPALCIGWAVSNADVHGHVCYRPTPDGRAAATAWSGPLDSPHAVPGALEAYGEALNDTLCFLRRPMERPRDLGEIPLSAADL